MLTSQERGSATVESIFAIVMLTLLTLGAVQVAFVLYARNVLASAAHEGARAAVERGAGADDAPAVAGSVVRRAAGGLVSELEVDAAATPGGPRDVLTVRVRGTVAVPGPVPFEVPVTATATSVRERGPR
ncbi:MAG TPA: TadE family protein [Actinomycetota bacterium]|nr:TadE family protein [Actinomycetota bacterium]